MENMIAHVNAEPEPLLLILLSVFKNQNKTRQWGCLQVNFSHASLLKLEDVEDDNRYTELQINIVSSRICCD